MDELLDRNQVDRAHALAQGIARRSGGADAVVAATFARLVAASEWHAAFTLACRHLELRDLGPRTKAAVARAAVAAGSDPDGMAALAALVAGGDYAPLANGLYLIGAAAGGRDVDLSLAAPRLWEGGMFLWLEDCEADLLAPVIALARPAIRAGTLAAELAGIVDRMPPALPGDSFRDRPSQPIQFVPAVAPDADCLLVCLAGIRGGIGMPQNVFHRWAARTPAHLLYLRDGVHHDFRDGLAQAGPGFPALVTFVGEIAATLGVARVATWGNSGGGLAAARLALATDAGRAVVLAGIVGPRGAARPAGAQAGASPMADAVRTLAAQREAACDIRWLFARGHEHDAADARAMADVPGVTEVALPIARHNVASHLVATDALAPLLAWVTGAAGGE